MNRTRLLQSTLAFFFVCLPASASAQQPPGPAPEPVNGALFSALQVERGDKVFKNSCSTCHATTEFVNPKFSATWNDRPVFELFDQLRTTMPQDNPGSLPGQDYIDVIGYLLKLLGADIGEQELPPEESSLKAARIKVKPTN